MVRDMILSPTLRSSLMSDAAAMSSKPPMVAAEVNCHSRYEADVA